VLAREFLDKIIVVVVGRGPSGFVLWTFVS
jgi:hypothetical protein